MVMVHNYLMRSGEKIKKLRNEKSLSQEKLSKKLESMSISLKQETLSRIEADARRLWDNELFAISRIFGVTVDYLSDDSKPYPPANGDRLIKAPPEATKEDVGDHLYGKAVDKIILTEKDIELWAEPGQRLATLKRGERLIIEGEGISFLFRKKE